MTAQYSFRPEAQVSRVIPISAQTDADTPALLFRSTRQTDARPLAADAERADPLPAHSADPGEGSQHRAVVRQAAADGRLILVGKARGGVGATSLAVNLGLALLGARRSSRAKPGGHVAVVDLDIQFGGVASLLDLEDRGAMIALARMADDPDRQAVRNAILTHRSGLRVLAAPREAVPLEAFDAERIAAIVAALLEDHEFVVVDLPPALVQWLEPLVRQADRLLLLTDLSVPSITRCHRLIGIMLEDNPQLRIDIVVSGEKKPLLDRTACRNAASALGRALAHWVPNDRKVLRNATDRGEPAVRHSPLSAYSRSIQRIARSLQSAPTA